MNTYTYYDEIAEGYNRLHGKEQKEKLSVIKEILQINPGKKLLDIGCGTAISFEIMKCDCYGIEPAKKLVEQTKKENQKKIIIDVAENLQKYYIRQKFDYIICVSVAHHFTDIEKVLKEIHRLSHRDTQIVFSLLKRNSKTQKILEKMNEIFKENKRVEMGIDLVVEYSIKES